jgi:hypothetical protein
VLPDIDVVVEATRSGFEQFVVVKSPSAVSNVDQILLPLSGAGVASTTEDASGSLTIRDKSGSRTVRVPTPMMWDSQLTPNDESPANSTAVDIAVRQPAAQRKSATVSDGDGSGVTLVLTPDPKWLTNPETKFPVTIDPQINRVLTTFDTTVSEGSTVDQGGADYLRLGPTTGTSPKKSRSFVHWDSTALRGKQITAARAYFFNWYSTTCTPLSLGGVDY